MNPWNKNNLSVYNELTSDRWIILADVTVKLYSWTLKFYKVVQQQIWGEVVDFIAATSGLHLRMQQ